MPGWWSHLFNGGSDPGPNDPAPADAPASPAQPRAAASETVARLEGIHPNMSQIDQVITDLLAIEGATGAAIVDISSGMALATGGNPGFNLDVAAAGNSNVVRAKLNTMSDLGVTESIDDILITLDNQYHLINVLSADATKGLFIYLVLNKRNANLALARHKLSVAAKSVTL